MNHRNHNPIETGKGGLLQALADLWLKKPKVKSTANNTLREKTGGIRRGGGKFCNSGGAGKERTKGLGGMMTTKHQKLEVDIAKTVGKLEDSGRDPEGGRSRGAYGGR